MTVYKVRLRVLSHEYRGYTGLLSEHETYRGRRRKKKKKTRDPKKRRGRAPLTDVATRNGTVLIWNTLLRHPLSRTQTLDTRHSGAGTQRSKPRTPDRPSFSFSKDADSTLISSSLINEVSSTIGRVSRPSDVLAVLDCESPRPYARAIARSFRVRVRVGVAHRFPWHPCIAPSRHGLHLPGPSEQQQRPPHSRAARDLLLLGNIQ